MKFLPLLAALTCASPALAEYVVASHTIRAQTIIEAKDLALKEGEVDGAATPEELIGQETRMTIYAGRPLRTTDVGPPAVIERNQVIPLVFQQNGLVIHTEGRSLSRAGPGEFVRVMNLASRATVSGRVSADGRVFVSQMDQDYVQ